MQALIEISIGFPPTYPLLIASSIGILSNLMATKNHVSNFTIRQIGMMNFAVNQDVSHVSHVNHVVSTLSCDLAQHKFV